MNHGFVRVAAATPKIKVADCGYNADIIMSRMDELEAAGVEIAVFPELCITGYTCQDLFWQMLLLENAKKQLVRIAKHTEERNMLVLVGLPFEVGGKLYNAAAVLQRGKILGMVPKTFIPNYSEFYEARHFTSGKDIGYTEVNVSLTDEEYMGIPFGTKLLFPCAGDERLVLGIEICEDLWVPNPPSIGLALAGASLIANLSASDEITGKDEYRRNLVAGQSASLVCGYIYASAGEGESSQDLVFSGHNIIAEDGIRLAESEHFKNQTVIADIDIDRLYAERRRMGTFGNTLGEGFVHVYFDLEEKERDFIRYVDPAPFVPSNKEDRDRRCEDILSIQTMGLKKRLEHIGAKYAVVGISGGLDSTLALLVMARAFDALGLPRENMIAVTMPGFGTTDRTYTNACHMVRILGAALREIPIGEAVTLHFRQIGHNPAVKDVTYENGQARQRTYLLMDIANQCGGIVIGTGDMSELALGWATYNGDHMSMYGVNCGVPKTLVRHLVRYVADTATEKELADVLYDVLDTPVSPELLPPEENGEIAQKTEDLVGPYELHDFFLYYVLRLTYPPKKIYFLAKKAFSGVYDDAVILKWLKKFYWRFFSQQFKRSCLPDGPKVGSVAVSPRGDLRMPSDACVREWQRELEEIG